MVYKIKQACSINKNNENNNAHFYLERLLKRDNPITTYSNYNFLTSQTLLSNIAL